MFSCYWREWLFICRVTFIYSLAWMSFLATILFLVFGVNDRLFAATLFFVTSVNNVFPRHFLNSLSFFSRQLIVWFPHIIDLFFSRQYLSSIRDRECLLDLFVFSGHSVNHFKKALFYSILHPSAFFFSRQLFNFSFLPWTAFYFSTILLFNLLEWMIFFIDLLPWMPFFLRNPLERFFFSLDNFIFFWSAWFFYLPRHFLFLSLPWMFFFSHGLFMFEFTIVFRTTIDCLIS